MGHAMTTLRARHVFPVDRPPIENGIVRFDHDRIVEMGRFENQSGAVDLGDVAIIPGLVNAHTHLEFSDLKEPLGEPRMPLAWWIREVIKQRAAADALADSMSTTTREHTDPVQMGIEESARCGVTTIGDISNTRERRSPVSLDCAQYLELRGIRKQDVEAARQGAAAFLADRTNNPYFGVSPHAPYTVHRELFSWVVGLAMQTGVPLAMHLAETREELDLLQTLRGPLRDLLEERGWWEGGAIGLGLRPMDYLQQLAAAPRSMIIHGNYLSPAEISFVAEHRDRMTLVRCPRTNAYFGHHAHSLWLMLQTGLGIALGTDSRASNPDLDLRKEMQFVVEHLGLSPEQSLRLGTINGAIAMGLHDECGTITPGKAANLAILQLPSRTTADTHELLFEGEANVVATICRGQVVFSEHPALPPLSTAGNS
jgi:cytosine/adenosine deaminase-related metal-dependent hydrolase